MPFSFASLGTGAGLTSSTVTYYVGSIPSTTTFGISTSYANALAGTLTTLVTTAYSTASTITNTGNYFQQIPSFVLGFNLDSQYQSSATAMSGMNTQSGNVFLNATAYSAAPTVSTRLDAYAHYDAILVIDPASRQMSIQI